MHCRKICWVPEYGRKTCSLEARLGLEFCFHSGQLHFSGRVASPAELLHPLSKLRSRIQLVGPPLWIRTQVCHIPGLIFHLTPSGFFYVLLSLIGSSVHPFTSKIFIEHLPHTRHCSRLQGYSGEQGMVADALWEGIF